MQEFVNKRLRLVTRETLGFDIYMALEKHVVHRCISPTEVVGGSHLQKETDVVADLKRVRTISQPLLSGVLVLVPDIGQLPAILLPCYQSTVCALIRTAASASLHFKMQHVRGEILRFPWVDMSRGTVATHRLILCLLVFNNCQNHL